MSPPRHVEVLVEALRPRPEGGRRLISVPGCWDGLTALLIEQAGFEAAFLTGGGLSMARFGRPDMGLVTATEVEDAVCAIRDRISLPLLVDADTGFGNALNVARTVRRFERAGASAIQLEDQAFPKRCGHMEGKALVSLEEAVGKIRAALDAREHALVIARTDAVSVEGLAAALQRAEAYLAAGADLIFVEGPRSLADTAEVGARFGARAPLVHNLVEGGVTATQSGEELERLGFAVALHPLVMLHGLVAAAPELLARLRVERSTEGFRERLVRLEDVNRLTGAGDLLDLGRRFAGG